MKALSIKQPWVYAILYLGKNIENRSWNTNFRGEFLIHAPLTFDLQGYDFLLKNYGNIPKNIEDFKRGGILGKIQLIDVLKPENNNINMWSEPNKYGFVLKNPRLFNFIEYKGELKFFDINLDF